jgi:hypothetical protein
MADPRRGVFNSILPLDVLILQQMPKEGAMFMGVYPEAASIADIQKAIAGGKLASPLISTRLRVLHQFELAKTVQIPKSPTAGWQITAKGEQFVRENSPKTEADDGS